MMIESSHKFDRAWTRRSLNGLLRGWLCVLVIGVGTIRTNAQPSISATPVVQFNGATVQLPATMSGSRQTGLSLTVDSRWANSYGYHPVEVTITSPKPMANDHTITIQLRVGWNREVSVEQSFELPAGNTTATTSISLPSFQLPKNYLWWDLWVDGVKDKDLSIDRSAPQALSGGNAGTTNSSVTFLVPGAKSKNRLLVGSNGNELQVLTLDLAAFPNRWIDYTAFDVVALSMDEAEQLAKNQPESFAAVARWGGAGGQLWISDVGTKLERLPELSKLLHLPEGVAKLDADSSADEENKDQPESAGGPSTDTDAHLKQEGWRIPVRTRRFNSNGMAVTFLDKTTNVRRRERDPDVIARLKRDSNYVTMEQQFDQGAPDSERRSTGDSSQLFVEQALGLGSVRAFRESSEVASFPLTPSVANANAIANTDGAEELPRSLAYGLRRTLRWDARHGMTPDSANLEFARFFVPGVGVAPVTEFRVLITLFVLLIGPLNYWFLKRVKRLHLMVLTVPLAAAITTLALFTYAILADGFDTRVRAQSFTKLDQRTGEADCWTRLSYYAGLSPGHGLVVPADMTLYPILPSWVGDSSFGEQREVVWAGDEARLKQGWLNSRTPTQYLTVRARKSPMHLEVLDSGDKLRIKNQLGTRIKTLILINEVGKTYFGEDIAEDAEPTLQPIARDDAISRFNKLVVANTPEAPAAMATGESDLALLRSRSRYQTYGRYGAQPNTGKLSENLANAALANLAGLAGQPALDVPPRTYVAITERGPEVETGISYAKEEAGFHVIEGRW